MRTDQLLLAATLAAMTASARADQPMNIVMLLSDDQRFDALGAAGNEVVHTPRLDQLARAGVRFPNAYVTTSICMTSRASILTGQYMSRHGIDRFGKPLPPGALAATYVGLLRDAGYWNGYVGKWHVGRTPEGAFDFVRSYQTHHWFEIGGERIHVTERNARDSIEFLETRPKDKPFVLSVSYFAPHAQDGHPDQYLPQDWSARYYENTTVPTTPMMGEAYLRALPPFLQSERNEGRIRFRKRFDTPERFQTSMINYYRLITEVDEAVGRLIDKLKEQGVYENTLIIYMGDNGYYEAERGLADKWYPHEESIRVPLIIHDPRLPEDRRGMTPAPMALNIDIAPTILAAAGLEIPSRMQGRDLAPLYLADTPPDDWRDEFFYEHPTITNKHRIPSSLAVVRSDLKFVVYPEWEHEELFDLVKDPTERNNVVDHPGYAEVAAAMRDRLGQWREKAR